MHQPFEVSNAELEANLEGFVDAAYASLESSTLVMPKGAGFVGYDRFSEAYECLKLATAAFRNVQPDTVWNALRADSLSFLVLRTILGMTPPEWGALASAETGIQVEQGTARAIDQKIRTRKDYMETVRGAATIARLHAMVDVACKYISTGAPAREPNTVHRLDKVDTAQGLASLQRAAALHVPYAVLLYERYLGRPFASHRDSVSELIGDVMESAVENLLSDARISHRRTKRAERIPGFDQAPDFMVPDEFSTKIVIEAKITNDDGTARDKFTRIIHLAEISRDRVAREQPGFQVIACIDGRGFGVRREDMRRLLVALQGKVFTFRTVNDHG